MLCIYDLIFKIILQAGQDHPHFIEEDLWLREVQWLVREHTAAG